MGLIYTDEEGRVWKDFGRYRVCTWDRINPFKKIYKYTGFMKNNLVYLSVIYAINSNGRYL